MLSTEFGTIWEWAGSIASIPTGFVLCDGTEGTPDLRNKFVVGAGDSFAVNEVGGVTIHNHPFTGDGHTHDVATELEINPGAEIDDTTASTAITGTSDNKSQRPPFYALAYLMKIT